MQAAIRAAAQASYTSLLRSRAPSPTTVIDHCQQKTKRPSIRNPNKPAHTVFYLSLSPQPPYNMVVLWPTHAATKTPFLHTRNPKHALCLPLSLSGRDKGRAAHTNHGAKFFYRPRACYLVQLYARKPNQYFARDGRPFLYFSADHSQPPRPHGSPPILQQSQQYIRFPLRHKVSKPTPPPLPPLPLSLSDSGHVFVLYLQRPTNARFSRQPVLLLSFRGLCWNRFSCV